MAKYLLPCGCGQTVPVDVGQAGGQVVCACGSTIDVPPLRMLRHLPTEAAAVVRSRSSWSSKRGTVAALLVLACLPAAWAAWSRWSEPWIEPFDASARSDTVEKGLDRLTPFGAWELWVARYRPLAESGFAVLEHPHAAQIEQIVTKQRFLQKVLLVVAGLLAGAAVIAAVWPGAAQSRR